MKKYFATVTANTSSIYGNYMFSVGSEVPELFAMKFPQYVSCVEVEDEIDEEEEVEIPTKKQRRFNNE